MENQEVEEVGELNVLNTGIGLLVFAPMLYGLAHYILYEYVGAWMLEWGSYFFAFFGILFLIGGILGRIFGRGNDGLED
jgi:hypothetical protein